MATWRIYYAPGYVDQGYVEGKTRRDWRRAPDRGVQVVVLLEPYPDGRRPWRGVDDRQIWTGDDVYDPFGFGKKFGLEIPRQVYDAICERAFYD